MIINGDSAQQAMLRQIKYFLLDMDGTLYLENTLLDGTLDFLDTLKKQGKHPFYITNNSSRATRQYIEKLAALGIAASEEEFCTSANALVYQLNRQMPGARMFLVGTPALREYVTACGYSCVPDYTADPNRRPQVVVLAFDSTLTYDKLRIACDYISEGVTYWATHPDKVCPVGPGRSVPDAGSFIDCIRSATGREPSFIAGKPNPCIIRMIQEQTGAKPEEIAVVGDRLNTDILSAVNAGVASVCVLTGESTLTDIEASPFQPDVVCGSIRDLCRILQS